ncbi:unnamed protein product [Moneuplotes crassus]|uniref:Uncharacterized protein n=1 Tax=Euplotes crassus TaxID=5936 RepID=A0AAD1U7F7_EUPCR|nr:unnamed protein product [Moneuplotes crassus]
MESLHQDSKADTELIKNKEESIMREEKMIDYLSCAALQLNIHSLDFFTKIPDLGSIPDRDNTLILVQIWEDITEEEYSIYLDEFDEATMFKKLAPLPYFDGDGVNLFRCGQKQEFWKYLCQSFPKKLNGLWVFSIKKEQSPLAKYFNSIIRISHTVSKEVRFSEIQISQFQLKRLIVSFKHVKVFALSDCNLSLSMVPDFSHALKHTKIRKLELLYYQTDENWKTAPEVCMKLLQGLATSQDFLSSLRKLSIQKCGVTREEVEHFLKQNKLDIVKLWHF